MVSQSIVGLTLPNPYPSGGTITITSVFVDKSFTDPTVPVIVATIKWSTHDDETLATLAPGTMLWDALQRAYPFGVPAPVPEPTSDDAVRTQALGEAHAWLALKGVPIRDRNTDAQIIAQADKLFPGGFDAMLETVALGRDADH